MGFVLIKHPDIDGIGEVTEEAFETNYKLKGWELVNAPDVVANTPSMAANLRAEAEAAFVAQDTVKSSKDGGK